MGHPPGAACRPIRDLSVTETEVGIGNWYVVCLPLSLSLSLSLSLPRIYQVIFLPPSAGDKLQASPQLMYPLKARYESLLNGRHAISFCGAEISSSRRRETRIQVRLG